MNTVPYDLTDSASVLAVIHASNEPLLLLSADQRVIAASESFCQAFNIPPVKIKGNPLAKIGKGAWAAPRIAEFLTAAASNDHKTQACEISLSLSGHGPRSLVLHSHLLREGQSGPIRLLMAVSDVTDLQAMAEQNADLNRRQALLMQEVQHRVANSLQIIASVLMQSARRVQSAEARQSLLDAQFRVMAVATVQRQLAAANGDSVVMRSYLTQLCKGLAASLVADPDQVALDVTTDESRVSGAVLTNLGLIVSELVINALKHAFPDQRQGTIHIDFRSDGEAWILSVKDDGVGMAACPVSAPEHGLGTGILDTLARTLKCSIRYQEGNPGTIVTLSHHADAKQKRLPASASWHALQHFAAEEDRPDFAQASQSC